MSDLTTPYADAIAKATIEGYEVIKGDDHTLLIDLDSEGAIEDFDSADSQDLRDLLDASEIERWTSKSGKGLHVRLHTGIALNPLERLVAQAALGSDPKREILGILRLKQGEEETSLLFKPKPEPQKLLPAST